MVWLDKGEVQCVSIKIKENLKRTLDKLTKNSISQASTEGGFGFSVRSDPKNVKGKKRGKGEFFFLFPTLVWGKKYSPCDILAVLGCSPEIWS